MAITNRSIQQIIQEQVKKWELACKLADGKGAQAYDPVITISRQPGCNTVDIAKKLSEKLGFDVFDKNLLDMVAENTQLGTSVMASLDEREVSIAEELVKSLVDNRYYSAYKFFHHLLMAIAAIAQHGHSVIVGRGAGFILPPAQNLRVSIIAPLDARVDNVVRKYGVSREDARRRVIQRESDRQAYIRKHFNADMLDPMRYDLTINLAAQGVDAAVDTIISAWRARKAQTAASH
ncbi:MAG: cytidylate kinase-like family protein [Elusimicrobia bacterium]|nr:cytidylate kinase-like family protein [Elusimicrobiota bacterium]